MNYENGVDGGWASRDQKSRDPCLWQRRVIDRVINAKELKEVAD
jgi:hypothetical protein